MDEVKIGTCGYGFYDPGEGWKDEYESKLAAYSDAFAVGEINRTFYSLPQVSTTERWRREAVESFEFTLKAWQALTYPTSSPTWNDHRDGLTEEQEEGLGYLQPTDVVVDAREETRKRAEALEARVVVIQTPPSFDATEDHEENMRTLFSKIDRGDLGLAWEPRGDWSDHPERIADICADLNLVHVVDLMRRDPLCDHDVAYVRLHGLNEDPYDYDYDYSEDELVVLAERFRDLSADRERVYCLFNNYEKFSNAVTITNLLA